MRDEQRRKILLRRDVARSVVVNDLDLLQVPRLRLRPVKCARRHIIRYDVVVPVLLENLHGREFVAAGTEALDKPGPVIGPIAKDLALDPCLATLTRSFEKVFARKLGMGPERVIQTKAAQRRQDPENK